MLHIQLYFSYSITIPKIAIVCIIFSELNTPIVEIHKPVQAVGNLFSISKFILRSSNKCSIRRINISRAYKLESKTVYRIKRFVQTNYWGKFIQMLKVNKKVFLSKIGFFVGTKKRLQDDTEGPGTLIDPLLLIEPYLLRALAGLRLFHKFYHSLINPQLNRLLSDKSLCAK